MKKFKISFNAPVVLSFVIVCFVVTTIGNLNGGRIREFLFMAYHSPLTDPFTFVRLFTHVFGHADWQHFVGNISYLLLLGPMLEEKYGSSKLAGVIGLTALITELFIIYCFGMLPFVEQVVLSLHLFCLLPLPDLKRERFP